MPRQSAAALAVLNLRPGPKRPEPPHYLGQTAANEWRAIVDSMPADWFPRETHALLAQLCRIIDRCKAVSAALDKTQRYGLSPEHITPKFEQLLALEMRLSDSIARLSTKLRLTQQSSTQYDKQRSRKGEAKIPWEEAANEDESDAG